MLTGGLALENVKSDGTTVVYDPQVDFSEKIHDHDGINSRSLFPNALRKECFDLNATQVLWASYFTVGSTTYLVVGGSTSVACTIADAAYFYGESTINQNWTTGDSDHAVFDSLLSAFSGLVLKIMVCSVPYLAATVTSEPFQSIGVGTDTPGRITLTTKASSTHAVSWIAVFA